MVPTSLPGLPKPSRTPGKKAKHLSCFNPKKTRKKTLDSLYIPLGGDPPFNKPQKRHPVTSQSTARTWPRPQNMSSKTPGPPRGYRTTGGERKSSPLLIGPKRWIDGEINYLFPYFFYLNCRVLKLRFLAFPWGPGGFRDLREAFFCHDTMVYGRHP